MTIGTPLLLGLLLVGFWIVFSCLHLLLSGRWWAWELTSIIPPSVVGLALILSTILLVVLRAEVLIAVLLIPALIWLPQLDIAFPRPQSSASSTPITLFDWNTAYWHSTNDPQEFVQFVLSHPADIYVLQEAMLADATHQNVQAEVQSWFPNYHIAQQGELVVASRFPIVGIKAAQPFLPWSNFMRADLDLNGEVLSVYNIHLPVPFRPHDLAGKLWEQTPQRLVAARQQAMQTLLAELEHNQNPHILAGDFNSIKTQALIRPLLSNYQDAFAAAGQGVPATFKFGPLHLWRLDWVFGSKRIAFHDYQSIHTPKFSDHDALQVSFSLRP